MQTHEDRDFQRQPEELPFLSRLKQRAESAMKHELSSITAGKKDEPILDEWRCDDIQFTQRPEDEQAILRVSIGGAAPEAPDINYCVFRGDRRKVIALLRQAISGLERRYIVGETEPVSRS